MAHLRSEGGQSGKVLWKAGIEGKLSLEDDDNKNPKDVDNDKTEIDDKDSYIKVVDQSFDQKGSRDIEGNSTDENQNKTSDFESLVVDDRKEGSKDVDGDNNVD